MYRRMGVLMVFAFLLAYVTPEPAYAIDCGNGILSHPATASEALAGGIAVGMPVCPADTASGITDASGDAYRYLLSVYVLGSDSAKCGPDMKTEGITKLNADFAIRLAALLKSAQAAVGPIGINSAYRCESAQSSANPAATATGFVSMHTKGLAVDLIYPGGGTKFDCTSPGYRWIEANARAYGIALYNQVHSPVAGECNHIEDTTKASGLGMGQSPFQTEYKQYLSPEIYAPRSITPWTSLSAILSAASALSGLGTAASSPAPNSIAAQTTPAATSSGPSALDFGALPLETQQTLNQLLAALSQSQSTPVATTSSPTEKLLALLDSRQMGNSAPSSTATTSGATVLNSAGGAGTKPATSASGGTSAEQLELLRRILVLILDYLISLSPSRT